MEYFTEYGHSLRWLPQLPKKLQTRKLAEKVLKEKPQYFHYLRMEFITPEMSRLLCQKDQDNIRYFKERVMEFQKYTGFQPNSMDVKRISSISGTVMTAADTAV